MIGRRDAVAMANMISISRSFLNWQICVLLISVMKRTVSL